MSDVEFEGEDLSISQKMIDKIEEPPKDGLEDFFYKHFGLKTKIIRLILIIFVAVSITISFVLFVLANYNFNPAEQEKLLEERISNTKSN